jgi:hypothetical protein
MKKALLVFLTGTGVACTGYAQLFVENGAMLHAESGSTIYVGGNVEAYAPVSGTGTVVLNGTSLQSIRGLTIAELILDNDVGASLEDNLRVLHGLTLVRGNLSLNNYNLLLSESATIQNAGQNGIETNGTGVVRMAITTDLHAFAVPLISKGNYTPLLLTTRGRYHLAFVAIASKARASSYKPSATNDYLNNVWTVRRSGIEGSVQAMVNYSAETKITGDFNALEGSYWDDKQWNIADNSFSAAQRSIRANIAGTGGEITAMGAAFNHPFSAKPMALTPNPAKFFSLLNISAAQDGNALISISDVSGKIVRTQSVKLNKGWNQYNVNVQGLANGYYDVIVFHQGKKTSLKLIKN